MNKLYVLPVSLGKNSKAGLNGYRYGIPTKDKDGYPLPSSVIQKYITNFLVFIKHLPDYEIVIDDYLLAYMRRN